MQPGREDLTYPGLCQELCYFCCHPGAHTHTAARPNKHQQSHLHPPTQVGTQESLQDSRSHGPEKLGMPLELWSCPWTPWMGLGTAWYLIHLISLPCPWMSGSHPHTETRTGQGCEGLGSSGCTDHGAQSPQRKELRDKAAPQPWT